MQVSQSAAAAGWLVLAAVLLWSYLPAILHLAQRWATEDDYSHGFFVPVFAGVLLWWRRDLLPAGRLQGSWWGLVLIVFSGALRWASAYYQYVLLEPFSLIPCLAGLVLFLAGWKAMRWSWPAVAFLVFMIPLPGFVADLLSHPLQRIATICSTYSLQVLGVPAVARGNVIWLSNGRIGVIEACSGLRMMMVFFAVTVGASFLIQRPLWEKIVVALSAPAIAVLANVVRITVTGIAHETMGQQWADYIFHDLAGWLMMPFAMLLLGLELWMLGKVLLPPVPERPLSPRADR